MQYYSTLRCCTSIWAQNILNRPETLYLSDSQLSSRVYVYVWSCKSKMSSHAASSASTFQIVDRKPPFSHVTQFRNIDVIMRVKLPDRAKNHTRFLRTFLTVTRKCVSFASVSGQKSVSGGTLVVSK